MANYFMEIWCRGSNRIKLSQLQLASIQTNQIQNIIDVTLDISTLHEYVMKSYIIPFHLKSENFTYRRDVNKVMNLGTIGNTKEILK